MKVNGTWVKTITDVHRHLKAGSFTTMDLVEGVSKNMEKKSHLNAYVTKRKMNELMREAKHAHIRYKEGKPISALDGVPISIKDNLFVEGIQASAASRALEGFIAPVDATTTSRLLSKGSIVMGTANMDEFGMGSYG